MMNNLTTFYIIRHGESQANVDRILQGHSIDSPLTEKGRDQAKELAESLKETSFNAIYSSSSLRAKQTADIIGKELNLPVSETSQIRERGFGKYEGMNVDEFLMKYENFDSLSFEEKFSFQLDENEESNLSGVKRLIAFLESTAENHPGETILVVSHSGLIRTFLIYNGYGDFDSVGGIKNTGYIKVVANGESYEIEETKGLKTWTEDNPKLAKNH